MLGEDQNALMCDMAETYHVMDIWALPVDVLATLASGLRENSRIKMKLAGLIYLPVETILPYIADVLTLVHRSKDSGEPLLFSDVMHGKDKEEEIRAFDSGEDFMAEWKRLAGIEDV